MVNASASLTLRVDRKKAAHQRTRQEAKMAGSAKRAAAIARDRTLDLEHNLTRLGVCGKAYEEAAEIQMERNRTKIRAAKVENRQLRAALDTLLFADKAAFHVSDLERQVERVKALQRVSDEQKSLVLAKQGELDRQITRAKAAQLDLKGVVDDKTAIHRCQAHVALIQNRIAAAKMLRKSYTLTITPLRRERAAFEVMMTNYEKVLKTKERQLKNLLFLYHDAERARTQSKYELNEILLAGRYSDIRYNRDKKTPDSRQEMAEMDVQISKIKEALNQPNMKEIFLQLLEQEKRTQYYEQIYKQLMDIECNSSLTAHQRAMLRQNIPGIHVMNEVLHIEHCKRGPLFAPMLMSAVQQTNRVIGLLDRGAPPRMARHSGNLISMLTGTKRLADKIMMEDWGETQTDSSGQLLARCKRKLLKLLREVYGKIKHAKQEKERRKSIGDEVEDEVYNWIATVEHSHAERQQELEMLRITQASPSSNASHDIAHASKSLMDLLLTPDTEAESSASGQSQQAVGAMASLMDLLLPPATEAESSVSGQSQQAMEAKTETPILDNIQSIRKEIEELMERWIQRLEHGQATDLPESRPDRIVEDPRQEVEKLLESWIVMVEEKCAEHQDQERRKSEVHSIADQMQSWIGSLDQNLSLQDKQEEQELSAPGESSHAGIRGEIREQMDGWLAQLETRLSEP